jgi:hypothetical protein
MLQVSFTVTTSAPASSPGSSANVLAGITTTLSSDDSSAGVGSTNDGVCIAV